MAKKQKVVVVGAGPVGSLAALYAANRGDNVEIYELRSGESFFMCRCFTQCLALCDCSLMDTGWPLRV